MTGREMLQRLANRLSGVPQTIDFVAALNTTIQALEDHLWASSSDWLRQDLVLDFAAGDTALSLPDDFLGFVERPYLGMNVPATLVAGTDGLTYQCIARHIAAPDNRPVTGSNWATYWKQVPVSTGADWTAGLTCMPETLSVLKRVRLEPLPHNMDHQLAASGTVRYYELRGTTMKLIPVPNSSGAVTGRYYQRQPRLDTLDDDLPFNGFFDYVAQDAVVLIAQQGLLVCQTPQFVQMIANQVDRLVNRRAPKYVHFRGMK